MKRGTFILFLLVTATTVLAQKTVINGIVIDKQTGQAIEGVNVTSGGLSVVTNADGYFTLKNDSMPMAINVTHIGYRSKILLAHDLSTANVKIEMEPATILLREVFVQSENPRKLLAAAIDKIPQNYSQKDELYHCFYRETAMKRQCGRRSSRHV